jgi:hypothetical protein
MFEKDKVTHVGIVLDRSSSMDTCRQETIDGLNNQLAKLREADHEVRVTFVDFNEDVRVRLVNKSIREVTNLTREEYVPNGCTAMYDGVGAALDALNEIPVSGNYAYLLLIISDGQENSSRKVNASQLAERLKSLQATDRWTITYLGSNQDLTKVAKELNIPMGNMTSYTSNKVGTQHAMNLESGKLDNYLGMRSRGLVSTDAYSGKVGVIDNCEVK